MAYPLITTELPMDRNQFRDFGRYQELFGAVNKADPLYEAISDE